MKDIPMRPLPLPTLGVLGGMSNQATAEYYRLLNDGLNARLGGWDNGEIVIVSVNFGNIKHFISNGLWDEASAYCAEKLDRLERAGADLIICASNTMHKVVGPLMAERRTPFIHIVDPTGAAITKAGLSKVVLLGTASVMRSPEFSARLKAKFGITAVVPPEADIGIVDRIIFDELVRGQVRPESKAEYLRVIGNLVSRGAEG
jgi:aspartate racemase